MKSHPEDVRRVSARLGGLIWMHNPGRERLVFALIVLIVLVQKGLTAGAPFLLKEAVDYMGLSLSSGNMVLLVAVALIGGYVFVRLIDTVALHTQPLLAFPIIQRVERALAVSCFSHIHHLSLKFHLNRKTGSISKTMNRGMLAVNELVDHALFLIPVALETLLIIAILSIAFTPWLGLILAMTIGSFVWFTYVVTKRRNRVRLILNDSDNQMGDRFVDSLINYEMVKSYTGEARERLRFSQALSGYQSAARALNTSLCALNVGQMLILNIGLGAALVLVVVRISSGAMSLGGLVMVMTLFLSLYNPLFFLGTVYRVIMQSIVDLNGMFDLFDEEKEIVDHEGAEPLQVTHGEIVFEDVVFGYDGDRTILNGVSFCVKAGQKMAIVGATGAGKSTISRLLLRFYDVGGGRITIDGQSVSEVTQESLRASFGLVPQDTVLFNDSIGYNIAYGRPEANAEAMIVAAKGAQIHDFIAALPQGYDTIVGERGLKLSGGEKQRVAIARTLLKNPPLLILDEATSALDSQTENDIKEALDRAARGRTTVVIAHRLSTIVDADEILVLDKGKIVERGRHTDLVNRDGAYAALWKQQLREKEKDAAAVATVSAS